MGRKKEQLLWDRMRTGLKRHSSIRLQRIEDMLGEGLPDVLCLRDGAVAWVETKCAADIPARPSTPLLGNKNGLSVDQRNWHIDWAKHGGRSLVLVGIKDSRRHWLLSGSLADSINSMTLGDLRENAIVSGMSPEFWHDLVKVL